MSNTLTKGKIGTQDNKNYDGVNSTFSRPTSTGGTQTLLKPTAGTGAVDILAVYGGGTARTLATLNSALDAIASNNAAIIFTPGTWTITDDVTIPANIGIIPVVGAVLSVSAGKTLTINGDLWPYDAGFFAGSGTTDVSGVTELTIANMSVSSSGGISTDTISESTAGSGVTVDGVLLKDSSVTASGGIDGDLSATSVLVDGVTATTQTAGDNSTKVSTTAYVDNATSHRGCLVYRTAVQTISTGVDTNIDFPTGSSAEEFDTDSIHNPASASTRLTVPTGVTKIKLRAGLQWEANSSGYRNMYFRKNGANLEPMIKQLNDVDSAFSHGFQLSSPVIIVTSGDYFELRVGQTSGGDLDALGTSAFITTWFEMEIVE